jgi:hypothetical protein
LFCGSQAIQWELDSLHVSAAAVAEHDQSDPEAGSVTPA